MLKGMQAGYKMIMSKGMQSSYKMFMFKGMNPLFVSSRAWTTCRGHSVQMPNVLTKSATSSASRTISYSSYKQPLPSHPLFLSKKRYQSTAKDRIVWYPIPVGLGVVFLGILHLYHVNKREGERKRRIDAGLEQDEVWDQIDVPWYVHLYAMLPLRTLSRLWGYINNVTLPLSLREPIYTLYSKAFDCQIEEALDPNLSNYPNLASFFYRALKPGVRTIEDACIVSPADGRVLNFGQVLENGKIPQIKDVNYSLNALLGISSQNADKYPRRRRQVTQESDATQESSSTLNQSTSDTKNPLYYCVVYLAPGDYHRFHSPAHWNIAKRRHFAGELLSVSPAAFSLVNNLLVLNERVVLLGRWQHGFFSMIPVGATNVGSIKLNFDPELKTNMPLRHITSPPGTFTESLISLSTQKGEELGGFELGSTVVLVFEAPSDKKAVFHIEHGQKIKMGQALCSIE